MRRYSGRSVPRRTRSLLILSEAQQHLSEAFLTGARSTALRSLTTNINDFSNAIPAGTTGHGILSAGHKFLGLLSRLGDALLLLGVVILVEVVDVLLGLLDSLLSLSCVLFRSLGNLVVPTIAPLLDDIRLLLVLCKGLET